MPKRIANPKYKRKRQSTIKEVHIDRTPIKVPIYDSEGYTLHSERNIFTNHIEIWKD